MARFEDIIGQDHLTEYFKKVVNENKAANAYIIEGEVRSGKEFIAKVFSEALLCEGDSDKPCGKCQACYQMENNAHPDFYTITHEKPNTISVKDVREQIIDGISTKPFKGRYKIYLVNDAELMTEQAQNAILKTIEEPPAYAIFLLLSTFCFCVTLFETAAITKNLWRDLGTFLTPTRKSHHANIVCSDFTTLRQKSCRKPLKTVSFAILRSGLSALHNRSHSMSILLKINKKVTEPKVKIGAIIDPNAYHLCDSYFDGKGNTFVMLKSRKLYILCKNVNGEVIVIGYGTNQKEVEAKHLRASQGR